MSIKLVSLLLFLPLIPVAILLSYPVSWLVGWSFACLLRLCVCPSHYLPRGLLHLAFGYTLFETKKKETYFGSAEQDGIQNKKDEKDKT
jgi:hypothetical protein